MTARVYLAEFGDDRRGGLQEIRPVRTAAKAIKIANKRGISEIKVLGDEATRSRLIAQLENERQNQKKELQG
jgi:hypothetical protein